MVVALSKPFDMVRSLDLTLEMSGAEDGGQAVRWRVANAASLASWLRLPLEYGVVLAEDTLLIALMVNASKLRESAHA